MFYLAAAVSDFYVPASEMPEHKVQSSEGPLQVKALVCAGARLILPALPMMGSVTSDLPAHTSGCPMEAEASDRAPCQKAWSSPCTY